MSNEEVTWMKNGELSEVQFAREFVEVSGLVFADGAFFSTEGRITNEATLRKQIYRVLSQQVDNNAARRVENILQVMKLEALAETFDESPTMIHLKTAHFICRIPLWIMLCPAGTGCR